MGFQHRYGTHHIPWDSDPDSPQAVAMLKPYIDYAQKHNMEIDEESFNRFVQENHMEPCSLELWAPSERRHGDLCFCGDLYHENEEFTIYAMECEGDMSTRKGKINKVIKLMVAAGPIMCNDFATQCDIYDEVGIDSDTFTDQEVQYIESEVTKRLVYGY